MKRNIPKSQRQISKNLIRGISPRISPSIVSPTVNIGGKSYILNINGEFFKNINLFNYYLNIVNSDEINVGILYPDSDKVIVPDALYSIEYVGGTFITSGSIPSSGSALIEIPIIPCEPVTYEIKNLNNDIIRSGSEASGGNIEEIINNSIITLKDTANNTLFSSSFFAEENGEIIAPSGSFQNSDSSFMDTIKSGETGKLLPDVDLDFNGTKEGEIVSVKKVEVELVDSNGDPITPESKTLVGNKLTIESAPIEFNTTDTDRFGNVLPTILRNSLNPNKDWNAHNFAEEYLSKLTNPPSGGQEAAVFHYYQDMIDIGAYQKAYQIGLFIGGNADDHKWNARYPFDNIMSFPFVFVGSPTHSNMGIETNGSTSGVFCNMFAWQLPQGNKQMSIYKRNNTTPASATGVVFGANSSNLGIFFRGDPMTGAGEGGTVGGALPAGVFDGFLTANNQFRSRNGVIFNTGGGAQNTGFGFGIGCSFMNNLPVSIYRPLAVEFCYSYLGEALTAGQEADHYTIVQALQVALGRNI